MADISSLDVSQICSVIVTEVTMCVKQIESTLIDFFQKYGIILSMTNPVAKQTVIGADTRT